MTEGTGPNGLSLLFNLMRRATGMPVRVLKLSRDSPGRYAPMPSSSGRTWVIRVEYIYIYITFSINQSLHRHKLVMGDVSAGYDQGNCQNHREDRTAPGEVV